MGSRVKPSAGDGMAEESEASPPPPAAAVGQVKCGDRFARSGAMKDKRDSRPAMSQASIFERFFVTWVRPVQAITENQGASHLREFSAWPRRMLEVRTIGFQMLHNLKNQRCSITAKPIL